MTEPLDLETMNESDILEMESVSDMEEMGDMEMGMVEEEVGETATLSFARHNFCFCVHVLTFCLGFIAAFT